MSSLYELQGVWLHLYDLMDDPDVPEDTVLGTIESVDAEIEVKADAYAKIMKNLQADADALKGEIDRLTARKRTIDNNIKRMKDNLQEAMIATGKTKFKTDLFSFGIQKNGGKIPVIMAVDDTNALPDDLVKSTKNQIWRPLEKS